MVSAGPVDILQTVGDITNDTADLWTKSNLRVKRRDPWHQANARPKAVADLALSGEEADELSQTCLHPVREPVAATTSPSEPKSLTR